MAKLKVGALFAGIGGIELGFERTGGFETIWFVECEPYAQAVLRKHWPRTPIYGDIKTINFRELEPVDVLTGGFPCQDISNAGKRKGITGERSGLWKEYLRAISEIRPRYALVENVSALRNRGLSTVLGDLAEVGYDAEWNCLPASCVGAPHRRDRIYIVANPNKRCEQENEIFPRRNSSWGASNRKRNVAYANEQGISGRYESEHIEGKSEAEIRRRSNAFSFANYNNNWDERKKSLFEKNRRETWATDAGVLRVAHGVPNRIYRIKCVGNAVVPQVAEFVAEMILEKEKGEVLK